MRQRCAEPELKVSPVLTDSRVEGCAKLVPKLAEPRTFVKWFLKEEHSHQTLGQWR